MFVFYSLQLIKVRKLPLQKRNQVFVSYAHEDMYNVRMVVSVLRKRGLKVWFDKDDLKTGRWKTKITKAIAQSRYFIICISNAALLKTRDNPGFIDNELNQAYQIALDQPESEFEIIPVRFEKCDRGDIRLSSWHQHDLFEDFEKALDEIALMLGGISLSESMARDTRSKDEKLVDSLLLKAETFFYSGAFEEALKLYDSALIIEPKHHLAWNGKGVALGESGRYIAALAAFMKALEISPYFHDAQHNKGVTLECLAHRDKTESADGLPAWRKNERRMDSAKGYNYVSMVGWICRREKTRRADRNKEHFD